MTRGAYRNTQPVEMCDALHYIRDSSHGNVTKTPIVLVLYQSYDFLGRGQGIGNEACRVSTSFLEVNVHHKEPLEIVTFAQDWYLSTLSFY